MIVSQQPTRKKFNYLSSYTLDKNSLNSVVTYNTFNHFSSSIHKTEKKNMKKLAKKHKYLHHRMDSTSFPINNPSKFRDSSFNRFNRCLSFNKPFIQTTLLEIFRRANFHCNVIPLFLQQNTLINKNHSQKPYLEKPNTIRKEDRRQSDFIVMTENYFRKNRR